MKTAVLFYCDDNAISFSDFSELKELSKDIEFGTKQLLIELDNGEKIQLPCKSVDSVKSFCELIESGFTHIKEMSILLKDCKITDSGDWHLNKKNFDDYFIADIGINPKVNEFDFYEKVGKILSQQNGYFTNSNKKTENSFIDRMNYRPEFNSLYFKFFDFYSYGKEQIEKQKDKAEYWVCCNSLFKTQPF